MRFYHTRLTKYFFAVLVIVILIYAYFEARSMLYGPQIVIGSDKVITVEEKLIEIQGTVKNVVEISLNGRTIFIDDTGHFSEQLLLANGLNHFTLEARDKFNRKTQEKLEVVYNPPIDRQQQDTIETGTIEESLE